MSKKTIAWAPVPIRLLLGVGFIYHGAIKLFTSVGHENFLRLLNNIGVPLPNIASWLVGWVEFLGGIALVLGAFMFVTTIILILDMVVAMFWVNLPNGFDLMNLNIMIEAGPKFGVPGLEINLLYIAGLASLLLAGAGKFSIDERIEKRDITSSSD